MRVDWELWGGFQYLLYLGYSKDNLNQLHEMEGRYFQVPNSYESTLGKPTGWLKRIKIGSQVTNIGIQLIVGKPTGQFSTTCFLRMQWPDQHLIFARQDSQWKLIQKLRFKIQTFKDLERRYILKKVFQICQIQEFCYILLIPST